MRTVSCVIQVEGSKTSTVAVPFKPAEGTLQLTQVAIKCRLAPSTRHEAPSSTKEAYVPHKKRELTKKILVRLVAHVQGPGEAAEREFAIATVPLRQVALQAIDKDGKAAVAPVVEAFGSCKLDLRFQMETVRLSAEVSRVGYWNLHDVHDFNAQVAVVGNCAPIQ
jgi:hypothetical protein